jgi:hypothetical protein
VALLCPFQVVSWLRAPFPAKITNQTTAALTFDAKGADGNSFSLNLGGFECSMDSGSVLACTSPKLFNMLSDGEHVFRVRGKDTKGAPGPWNGYSWVVGKEWSFEVLSLAACAGFGSSDKP